MKLLDEIHERHVYDRRSRVLSDAMAGLVPAGSRVLDVGCGDGLISKAIREKTAGIEIEGIDVLVRPESHIPVRQFDGVHLPYADDTFDAVLFIDVLHHTYDPVVLLAEAVRVSKGLLLLKDHTRDGFLAGPTLWFMDWVGNARHGVSIPANYWPEAFWRDTFARLNLAVTHWTKEVPLYPLWASWMFGRSLHFVASLEKRRG